MMVAQLAQATLMLWHNHHRLSKALSHAECSMHNQCFYQSKQSQRFQMTEFLRQPISMCKTLRCTTLSYQKQWSMLEMKLKLHFFRQTMFFSIKLRTAAHSMMTRKCCRLSQPFIDESQCQQKQSQMAHKQFTAIGVRTINMSLTSVDCCLSRNVLLLPFRCSHWLSPPADWSQIQMKSLTFNSIIWCPLLLSVPAVVASSCIRHAVHAMCHRNTMNQCWRSESQWICGTTRCDRLSKSVRPHWWRLFRCASSLKHISKS